MKDTAWLEPKGGNKTPKIGTTLLAKDFEGWGHKIKPLSSFATNKIVPLGDIEVTYKISYIERKGTEHVTKACNNPEKGVTWV